MTIKITAVRRAYYNGEIIKPGQVITIKGNDVPSWAKKVNAEKTKEVKEDKKTPEAPAETEAPTASGTAKETETPADLSGKSEEELNKILDELRTKALDLNILIDTENKTVIEQIKELSKAIANKQNGV